MTSKYQATIATPVWQLRAAKIREHIVLAGSKGLEIGALHCPMVTKAEGDIRYVDYKSRDDLVSHYKADPSFPLDDIVAVDYVILGKTLREAVGPEVTFDYVIASHVIEHCPDIIGWLHQIAAILRPGGLLALAIPDKRFTFDYFRRCSTVGDLVDAFVRGITAPSPKQIIDHYTSAAFIDTGTIWTRNYDETTFAKHSTEVEGYRLVRESMQRGHYVEVHSYSFTPWSFLEITTTLFRLGLLPFRIKGFHETWHNSNEFVVTFERLADDLPEAERLAKQLASIPKLQQYPSESYYFIHHGGLAECEAQKTAELARVEQTLGQTKAQLEETKQALAAAERDVSRLLHSRSWKLTRPLRWMVQRVRAVRERGR